MCSNKRTSIQIEEYIDELIDEIPINTCLDIFLEGSYKHHSIGLVMDSGLARVGEMLGPKNLFSRFIDKILQEKPKNLRVHYTDLRSIPRQGFWKTSWSEFNFSEPFLAIFLSPLGEEFESVLSRKDLIRALDYLLTIETKKNEKYFLKIFETFDQFIVGGNFLNAAKSWTKDYMTIMNKELKKLDRSIMTRKTLISNLRTVYHNILNTPHLTETQRRQQYLEEVGQEIYDLVYQQIPVLEEDDLPDEYTEIFEILTAVPMDIYNLTRMFVKFNDKSEVICNNIPTIENVIVYSGSSHTKIYENFLNISFETQPEIKSVNDSRANLCLSVPEFYFWE